MASWGLDALLTGLAGRPVTAAQSRAARVTAKALHP